MGEVLEGLGWRLLSNRLLCFWSRMDRRFLFLFYCVYECTCDWVNNGSLVFGRGFFPGCEGLRSYDYGHAR